MSRTIHTISVRVTGKVGDLVYQRVGKGKGNIETRGRYDLQIRSNPPQTDRRSPAQLANRARIAAATAAYQALTPAERDSWRTLATKSKATGYNLFVRAYCSAHPIPEA